MTVIINRFDEDNPVTFAALNENFQAIVSAINAMAGSNVLQLGALADDSPQYMPKAGGVFAGQISAPAILVGADPVVTDSEITDVVRDTDHATTVAYGLVKQLATLADVSTSISGTYQQAEVTALKTAINALLAAMRTAGVLAP